MDNYIFGPHFIEEHLSASSCCHFLDDKLQLNLENIPFKQDAECGYSTIKSLHIFSKEAIENFNETYQGK
jgi:hypothetical protein